MFDEGVLDGSVFFRPAGTTEGAFDEGRESGVGPFSIAVGSFDVGAAFNGFFGGLFLGAHSGVVNGRRWFASVKE